MALSTWGMWEAEKQELASILRNFCDKDVNALLGEAISQALDIIDNYFAKSYDNKLSLQENIMKSYELGFEKIRNTANNAADSPSQKPALIIELTQKIDAVIAKMLQKAKKYLPYISVIGRESVQYREKVFVKLYGNNEEHINPRLKSKVKVHDSQILQETKDYITEWMNDNPPQNYNVEMPITEIDEHLKYMNERAREKSPTESLEQQFQQEVGISMEHYKAEIAKLSAYIAPNGSHLPGYEAAIKQFNATLATAKQPAPEQTAQATC